MNPQPMEQAYERAYALQYAFQILFGLHLIVCKAGELAGSTKLYHALNYVTHQMTGLTFANALFETQEYLDNARDNYLIDAYDRLEINGRHRFERAVRLED